MIKIFSINEILDATNNFLKKKNEKKIKFEESKNPLVLNDTSVDHKNENNSLTLEDRQKFRKALGLDQGNKRVDVEKAIKDKSSEKSSFRKDNETLNHLSNNRTLLSIEEKKEKNNREKIVDEIYKVIKKKSKKEHN